MNCLGGTDAEMSIAVENLPLHWKKNYRATMVLKKMFFEFHCCDCIGPEILVRVHQIHLVSEYLICKH